MPSRPRHSIFSLIFTAIVAIVAQSSPIVTTQSLLTIIAQSPFSRYRCSTKFAYSQLLWIYVVFTRAIVICDVINNYFGLF